MKGKERMSIQITRGSFHPKLLPFTLKGQLFSREHCSVFTTELCSCSESKPSATAEIREAGLSPTCPLTTNNFGMQLLRIRKI
jgi:hypothetical protein